MNPKVERIEDNVIYVDFEDSKSESSFTSHKGAKKNYVKSVIAISSIGIVLSLIVFLFLGVALYHV